MTQSAPPLIPFFLSLNGFLQILLYVVIIGILIRPLGNYIARVYKRAPLFMDPIVGPIERLFYKLSRIDPFVDMGWKKYTASILSFSLANFLLLYLILRHQSFLPLNPLHFEDISPDLAFNIAASFVSNTNWQSYAGEVTLSHFSQMIGLTVQNFISAGIGLCVLMVFMRGFLRQQANTLGNFWVDLIRGILYIFLPLSLIMALLLGSQGVVQTFQGSASFTPWEEIHSSSSSHPTQKIPLGPVASQVAIKQLGSNGGGFFNANSAHPYENPTPLSNFLELMGILVIPLALCYTFGIIVRDRQQGWTVLKAMTLMFIPLCLFCIYQEQKGNPYIHALESKEPIDQNMNMLGEKTHSGGNMEGKETRFGILNSSLWSAATTATSNGSTNSSLDSFTAMGGAIPLLMMQFSEVIYGGVGTGLVGMIIFVIISVFMAGLMVGRTPEYLGKKIQPFEVKMASLIILTPPCLTLFLTAIAVSTDAGKAGIFNPGAHGFSEILYAFTSACNNNGSAFSGLSTNTPFYNILLGIGMILGRYGIMIPILAIAGSCILKKKAPPTAGTLSTTSLLFIVFLIAVIFIVGLLTYLTPFILGPVIEYLSVTPL